MPSNPPKKKKIINQVPVWGKGSGRELKKYVKDKELVDIESIIKKYIKDVRLMLLSIFC